MKITYIIIAFLLLGSTLSKLKGQNPNFIGGILLNFNGIQVEGEKQQFWDSPNNKIGGTGGSSIGIFVKREFTEQVYGVLELRYIQKGSIYEFANQYGNRALEVLRINYMELPLLIGYKFQKKRKPVYFEIGLAYSRMFKSEMKFGKLVERIKTPNAEFFKENDFSWVLDLKFPVTRRNNLVLGFRTEYSLFTIHKYYNLHNLDYGVELDYLIFGRK
jgi:hypothetical protein